MGPTDISAFFEWCVENIGVIVFPDAQRPIYDGLKSGSDDLRVISDDLNCVYDDLTLADDDLCIQPL